MKKVLIGILVVETILIAILIRYGLYQTAETDRLRIEIEDNKNMAIQSLDECHERIVELEKMQCP